MKNVSSIILKKLNPIVFLLVLVCLIIGNVYADSRGNRVQMDLKSLKVALLAYYSHCYIFPEKLNLLKTIDENEECSGWSGPYLSDNASLVDPWGGEYRLFHFNDSRVFFLLSSGEDKALGTVDDIIVSALKPPIHQH